MNIFILDKDIKKNCEFHCNKHVVKMILEYAQLGCSTHHLVSVPLVDIPYKKTHINHPCAIWARKSLDNYVYLISLGIQLCEEYTYRYGKIHKTAKVFKWLEDNIPSLPDIGLTDFALAMPLEYHNVCAVTAYRDYYINEKKSLLKYKNRNKPSWIPE